MKNPSKEYIFLFNCLSCAIDDMRSLQAWLTIMNSRAKKLYFSEDKNTEIDAIDLMFAVGRNLEIQLQLFQRLFIEAQQKAEDMYLDEPGE